MKQFYPIKQTYWIWFYALGLSLGVYSCIQTDYQEPLPETLRIVNLPNSAPVDTSFSLSYEYTDTNGNLVDTDATWSSSNEDILSITGNTASSHMEGSVTISVTSNGLSNQQEIIVTNSDDETPTPTENSRSGSLMGTGYTISGDFILEEIDGDLILTITGYVPDGPGPYFYLTNSETSLVNELQLGVAENAGDYTYNISELNAEATIDSYDYLMVWCEPFRVRLGIGEFNN